MIKNKIQRENILLQLNVTSKNAITSGMPPDYLKEFSLQYLPCFALVCLTFCYFPSTNRHTRRRINSRLSLLLYTKIYTTSTYLSQDIQERKIYRFNIFRIISPYNRKLLENV